MKSIQANTLSVLPLGKQGEHMAREVLFDLSEWVKEYGDGRAELIYQRPCDAFPYQITAIRENHMLRWQITSLDTEIGGEHGQCELRFYRGETVVKSRIWSTLVDISMNGEVGAVPPRKERSWVEQVLEAGRDAKDAAETVKTAAIHMPYPESKTNTWWIWDVGIGAYVDSGEPTCTAEHGALKGRDADDQHTIDAITDLKKELNERLKTSNAITALDIIKMMEE